MSLGSLFNLAGPDLIILALILFMLVAPVALVVVLVRVANRSRQSPPPLPKSPETSE
jgi:hypothetical protein